MGSKLLRLVILSCALLVMTTGGAMADGLREGKKVVDEQSPLLQPGHHRCLCPMGNPRKIGGARTNAWSLPSTALASNFDTTIHCLVLRFNFQEEVTDDPNTTGRGLMNLSRELPGLFDSLYAVSHDSAIARTSADSIYIMRHDHIVDPPPHDSLYYDQHLASLSRYWEQVSEGKVHLTWDIYPPARDSLYTLPYPMSHYGRCDFSEVIDGLLAYTHDAITLADAVSPEIDFSSYGAVFLFHSGSDGQSDIGFPATCSDLFTGFISLGYDLDAGIDDRVAVDNGADTVSAALIMPETVVQDNRVTALNAVLAHEFGHQLGLIDLYSTNYFNSHLGDFALMDNNGFGTGLQFDAFPNVLRVFGTMPVYPMAWSRAYLGFVDVYDLRDDTSNVMLRAAGLFQDPGVKVIRVPVTENEYYLIENRIPETDGLDTYVRFEWATSVIMGPYTAAKQFTGEYDLLLPGVNTGGMLIFHVDESVAELDYDGDGVNNFLDNQLQNWTTEERTFIKLMEADGLVAFGGYYRAVNFGTAEDMYREDRNHTLTPNTNPPSIDNSGNNTHIYIENIRRDTLSGAKVPDDKTMKFDLHIADKAAGFPVRVGTPSMGRAPIFDDLNGDGEVEIITTANRLLSVFTLDGGSFLQHIDSCPACPPYYDTIHSYLSNFGSVNSDWDAPVHSVPIYAVALDTITAGPATGRFPSTPAGERLVAVGFDNRVSFFRPVDENDNGRADLLGEATNLLGKPVAIAFGDSLCYVLTDGNLVYRLFGPTRTGSQNWSLPNDLLHGITRIGDALLLQGGSEAETNFHFISDAVYTYTAEGLYFYGPVSADLNEDGFPEVIAFTPDGHGLYLSIDTTGATPTFSVLAEGDINEIVTTNPIVGDVDLDGRLDVIVGGRNTLIALNDRLVWKTDFPREVDDRFTYENVIAAPILAQVRAGGIPESIFPTGVGNFYSYGEDRTYGFPLSAGEQRYYNGSSAVVCHDDAKAILGFIGGDGWFYGWDIDYDTSGSFWPMNGGAPSGSFAFEAESLVPSKAAATTSFDDSKFYNYPNPARDGSTRIRYYLGGDARSVELEIFDFSGHRIASLDGTTYGGADNEVTWDCSGVTTGVYRCIIRVEFDGDTETAFTDIAVIR